MIEERNDLKSKIPLIILTGPTAVGKTESSIKLAKQINGEIISADSMQVYKHMDIGTAKITKEEMNGVNHYLIDEIEPNEEFNVVKFKTYASTYINQIIQKGKIPIIVGGTGFYIQAILYDIDFSITKEDTSYRKELENLAKKHGNDYVHNMLSQVDSISSKEIHPNNLKRVIRALEYYKLTGEKISTHNQEQRKKESPYNFVYFVINDHRNILYEKIDIRVDQMVNSGLVSEVDKLFQKGYTKEMVSMQGLGYKEILDYLTGNTSLEEAIYILKRETRHFAKRQLTWFKREKEVTWVNKYEHNNTSELIDFMLQEIKKRNIV